MSNPEKLHISPQIMFVSGNGIGLEGAEALVNAIVINQTVQTIVQSGMMIAILMEHFEGRGCRQKIKPKQKSHLWF